MCWFFGAAHGDGGVESISNSASHRLVIFARQVQPFGLGARQSAFQFGALLRQLLGFGGIFGEN